MQLSLVPLDEPLVVPLKQAHALMTIFHEHLGEKLIETKETLFFPIKGN